MATFLEAFFVSYKAANLYNVADNVVFQDFDGLPLRQRLVSRETVVLTWGKGTLRARSLIKSRALRIAAGSKVFRVVLTVIIPSTKSSTQAIP